MNSDLQEYARSTLIKGLLSLPEENQLFFKRMYSHTDLEKNIIDVINDMPEDKLDWAMQQVERTINEKEK